MYKYETHLHTSPVSRCAHASVYESLEFYKKMGYEGIFITNHFIDCNISIDGVMTYEQKINYFFSDYEQGLKIGEEMGIKVFAGAEISCGGTDFLIYGLDKQWYLDNPQIMNMEMSERLLFMKENGALIVQAHPFREDFYIDHIRLYPRCIHGVEIINGRRPKSENEIATMYARHYNLIEFAGSDNHSASEQELLAGVCSDTPVSDINDFVERVKNGEMKIFLSENPLNKA